MCIIEGINYMKETQQEKGRSIIEILGILVVIGVLSIAALFGFTYAMNKYKANETIHDVMLRASNVPMIDEYYQIRPTNYAFKFPDLQDELSSMGYTMKTLKTDEFGYVYKVEAPSIPRRICSLILQMEPTDIDEIRIGVDKAVYKRGLWDLCETHVDESTDTVLMSFYFEKVCKTDADCSDCQECYQGRCKANYNLPGCGFVPPDPPIPIPDESCLETVEYQYGDNCEYTGECCLNPLAEGCPPSCTPKGCPTAPTCGTCEIKVYDAKGCHVGCQTTSCCPAPECGPDDVFDEDSCSCVKPTQCDPPCDECHRCDESLRQCIKNTCSIESCPEGQEASGYDKCGCIEGCIEKCPDLKCNEECTVPNYETCSCEVIPGCCPEFNGCEGCRIQMTDEKGCPTCSEDQTIPKLSGECCTVENGTCCPLTDEDCSCTPGEACSCEDMGGTTVTIAGGACCNEAVECCKIDEGDCLGECEPTTEDCPTGCGSAHLLNSGKTCSDGSEGYWSVEIKGKPSGEPDGCCLNCSGEPIPHAFWNGTSGECCFGLPYEDRNGNWGCCNTSEGMWVSKIYGLDEGEMCCPIGQKAYISSEYGYPSCCNGEIAPQPDGYYSCCWGQHAFPVTGHPDGEVWMCCNLDFTKAYWHMEYGNQCCNGVLKKAKSFKYDEPLTCCKEEQEAYWRLNSGSGYCCDGSVYIPPNQTDYECCPSGGTTPKELVDIEFSDFGRDHPTSDKACCPVGQKAYWTGSDGYGYNAQCCSGEPYMGTEVPECCNSYPGYNYETGEEYIIERKVVPISGRTDGASTCCEAVSNGIPVTGAYMEGPSYGFYYPRCCYGNMIEYPSYSYEDDRPYTKYACCPFETPNLVVVVACGDSPETYQYGSVCCKGTKATASCGNGIYTYCEDE